LSPRLSPRNYRLPRHRPGPPPDTSTAVRTTDATGDASVGRVDVKLEVVIIPASDVDRSRQFYKDLGRRLDADLARGNDSLIRPPGENGEPWNTEELRAAFGSLR
jgi:hypothetical protein